MKYKSSLIMVNLRQSLYELCHFEHRILETRLFMRLCFYEPSMKIECCQCPSSFVGVIPLLELTTLEIQSLPHFSPKLKCFDPLS